MKIESLNIVFYTSIFLLPGFFIRGILAQLNPLKKLSDSLAFLSCLMYSIINLATWSWAYIVVINMKNEQYLPLYLFWLIIVFLTLTSSVITAFIVGAIIQKRVIAIIGKFLNLNTIDPIETAWDWYFSRNEAVQILVTLKDDSEIAGWYGEDSFSSSIADDRDIFIQRLYRQDENGMYHQNPENMGFYIPKDSIKYIEFKKPMEVISYNEI